MNTGRYLPFLLAFCGFWAAEDLMGQTSRGVLRGTVVDPSGAAVPNAQVHAENVGTNIRTTATTSQDGGYVFVSLPPGTYRVIAESTGFKRGLLNDVIVHIGETTRADLTLDIGALTETVEVTGSAVTITPDSATAGTVITSTEFDKLPLAGSSRSRIATDFALLTPGVVGGQQRPGTDHTATTALSIDGSQNLTTDILVEGMSAGQFQNFGSFTEVGVPVEAVGEFNIIKGIIPAEHGYARTALLSFSLKSGSNTPHASFFYNFRNDVLNSRSFFEQEKLPFRHNNFGGTISGPVYIPKIYNGRDRTFFMASGDGSLFRGTSVVRLYTSPSAEFLRGDFSSLTTAGGQPRLIYDPATGVPDGRGGVTRTPFPGNIIPQERMSPIARQVAALIPPPNRPGNDANFVGRGGAAKLDNTFFNTKIDHRFTSQHSISSSFNYTDLPRHVYDNPYEGTPLLTGLNQNIGSRNFRFAHDFVMTPTTLNHWSFGYNRFHNQSASYSAGEGWVERLGLKGVGGDGSMPVFTFSSDGFPKMGLERWDGDVEENIMFRNTTSFIRNKHAIKVGFEMRSQWFKPRQWRNQAGTFTFSFRETALNANVATGNSFASFLLGYVDTANISTPLHVASQRPYYAGFIQDDFRVNSKLTLNIGLRYDLDLPPREQYDRASDFDFDAPNPGAGNLLGALAFAGEGPGRTGRRTFEDTFYGGWGPRIGLAWQLDRMTVIRTGYGISHSTHRLLNAHAGFSTTQTFITPDSGNTPAFLLDDGMPTDWPKPPFLDPSFGNNNNVSATIPEDSARMPRTQVWRLDIQRELPGQTLLEAAYVGTRGTHLNAGLRNINQVHPQYLALGSVLNANINSAAAANAGIFAPYPGFTGSVRQALRPYPQVLNIATREDKLGSSSYHSAQFKAQKRFASGLQYLVSYTFSKLMTDVPSGMAGVASSAIQNAYDRRSEWAVSSFDTPHNFWLSAIYELPFGKGRQMLNHPGVVNVLAGGWTVSGIVNYQSGLPLVVTQANGLPLFNSAHRPNRVLGVPARTEVTYNDFDPAVQRVFDPAAFARAGAFEFGNAGPRLGDARGFGIRREDLALRKITMIGERVRTELNVQSFNLLNRPYWGSANMNHSSSDFGKVTTAGPGRFVQLGLKLIF
jgi:hypothetical protein